jgi:hypothetical protein
MRPMHTYNHGEKQLLILNYVKESGSEGRSYTEIIKFAYELIYGKGTFNPITNRGYNSGIFKSSRGMWSRYTPKGWAYLSFDKGPGRYGRYTINSTGEYKIQRQMKTVLKRLNKNA